MKNHRGMYLAFFFQFLILLNAVHAFLIGDLGQVFIGTFMFACTFIPYIAARKMGVRFPWFVYFLIALALWFHTAGYIRGYYVLYYPYYDKIAHLVSGVTVALLGFLLVIFLDRYWKMNLRVSFIIVFTVIFGMALGGFWEIYEFLVDSLIGSFWDGEMQNSLTDTMLDMIFVLIGSVIVGVAGVFYLRNHTLEDINSIMSGKF